MRTGLALGALCAPGPWTPGPPATLLCSPDDVGPPDLLHGAGAEEIGAAG